MHLAIEIAPLFLRHVVVENVVENATSLREFTRSACLLCLRNSRTKALYRDLFENMMNIRAKSNREIVARNVVSHSSILFHIIHQRACLRFDRVLVPHEL